MFTYTFRFPSFPRISGRHHVLSSPYVSFLLAQQVCFMLVCCVSFMWHFFYYFPSIECKHMKSRQHPYHYSPFSMPECLTEGELRVQEAERMLTKSMPKKQLVMTCFQPHSSSWKWSESHPSEEEKRSHLPQSNVPFHRTFTPLAWQESDGRILNLVIIVTSPMVTNLQSWNFILS